MKALLLALPFFTIGCGTFQTHSKDDSQVNQIHHVAVVAFAVDEPASAEIGFNVGSGKLGAEAGGSMIPQNDPHVNAMYSELITSFHKTLNWAVLDEPTMTANEGYKSAYHRTMDGWQNKMPPPKGEKRFLVQNVMDYDSPRILDISGRDALIKALKVDAIVVAHVNVFLEGTTVMGIGSRHPRSRISFMVYRPNIEKPVWFEGAVDGDEVEESVGQTAFIDEGLLGQLALKSVRTAYAKINSTLE